MRYAARVDVNQSEIVNAMRAAGAYVYVIGLPVDLLVAHRNKWALVEIKSGPRKKFTALQEEFFREAKGGTLARVDSVDAALRLLKLMEAA
jgi:hypothetical protein